MNWNWYKRTTDDEIVLARELAYAQVIEGKPVLGGDFAVDEGRRITGCYRNIFFEQYKEAYNGQEAHI